MAINFYDFSNLHHQTFREKIKERIGKIIDTNAFIEGEFNHQFEQGFRELQGAKHCLLVANGTDALEISLKVSGVNPGDKVGVPGITFYASAEAIINIGAIPVFIDINSQTGLLLPESLERVHTTHSLKAVMPVHIYGLPAPIEEIQQFCDNNSIVIIEDAAQAQGASYSRSMKPVGSSPNLTTFSFYPTKNLSAFGDAGCILTQSDQIAKDIITERNHGRGDEQKMGRNSRCDHIQAAVLHLKLSEIEQNNSQRKKIATWYYKFLTGLPLQILPENYLKSSSWHLYPVQCQSIEQRLKLQTALSKEKISSTPFYEKALHQESALSHYQGETKNSEEFAGRTLCLPIHPFLKEEQIKEVVQVLKSYL